MMSTTINCYYSSVLIGALLFISSCHTAVAVPQISHSSPLNRAWLERRVVGSSSSNQWHQIQRGGGAGVSVAPPTSDDGVNVTATTNDGLNATSTVNLFSSQQSRIKDFFQRTLHIPSWSAGNATTQALHNLQERLNLIRANATSTTSLLSQRILGKIHVLETALQQHSALLGAVVATTTLAILSQAIASRRPGGSKGGLVLPTMYALALLGSSAGFHLFLYFITVGYAMGIAIPLTVALVVYNRQAAGILPVASNLHSLLTILWGIRLSAFVLWRELINWPQLHVKVMEVNQMATLPAKLLCWLVYSYFYVALATPCWSRLAAGVVSHGSDPSKSAIASWGALGYSGILLQLVGLVLESVADYQKSRYKAQEGHRNDWCHVGLWTFSTHPNYLGELLFWVGTYVGGVTSLYHQSKWKLVSATVGLVFVATVLRSAVVSLDDKQMRKYGYNLDFVEFRRTHSLIGPVNFSKQP